MPTINAWIGTEGQPDAIADIISYKSVSTGTITRGTDNNVAAKTIRLETLSGQQQRQGQNGMTYTIDAMCLAELNTDLRVGDRFTVNSQRFEVVIKMPGHIDCEQYYLRVIA